MNEKYSANPVMFRNNPIGFLFSIILIPFFGLGILILLWWFVQCKSTRLTVSDNEILYEKGILSKERSEVNISSIRTIRVKQSFFNRLFGVGTVEIYTAGDNAEFVARGLPNPNQVRELIKMEQQRT